ncbi:MAG: hypothetical protein AAGF23_03230 [Acidobacteriota bacterium]
MRARFLALATAGSALLAYMAAELYVIGHPGFPLDDSWIHLHFASSIAAGEGLAYNPGQWVAGSSAPLWTALLAPAFVLSPVAAILWAKLLGAIFLIFTVFASFRLATQFGLSRFTGWIAAGLVGTSHWLLWAALSGMEITLFACLSLWGLVLHGRERRGGGLFSIAVLALACLARPEGALLLVLALVDRWLCLRLHPRPALEWRKDPQGVAAIATAVLLVAPVALFYFVIGDSPAPSTLAAKTQPDFLPNGDYLRLVVDVFWRSQPVLLLLAAGGALRVLRRSRPGGGVSAAWLVCLPLAYSLLASPGWSMPLGNFGRYYMPLLPLVVVFGLATLDPVFEALEEGFSFAGRQWPLRALLLLALFAPHFLALGQGPARYVQTVANVEDSDVRAALWLRSRLPPDALLAVQDVGALKFFLPNPVIDLAGLVSPEIVPILRADDGIYWEQRLAGYLAEQRPDYLVVFTDSYPMLSSPQGFERVISFQVENNVTMAGDELVVLKTPWCDRPLVDPQDAK